MDARDRIRRRARFVGARASRLLASAVDEAPSALGGIATVVIAAVLVLLAALVLSVLAALLL